MSSINIKKTLSRHRNRRKAVLYRRYTWSLRTMVAIMAVLGGFAGGLNHISRPAVLAYATNVSHNGLLVSTNQQRTQGGLASLAIDGRLNSAAQAKAQDMVDKDYWSHTSPDGRQPWDFIITAGYSYSRAGENLAYGALTSAETVAAWMNSPGHRANIMNAGFSQVGFGFANSPNFQNRGPQTVVVAMYAFPYVTPPTPPAPAPQPTPSPTPSPAPQPAPSQPSQPPAAAPGRAQPTSRPAEPMEQSTQDKPDPDEPEEPERDSTDENDSQVVAAMVDRDGAETVAPAEQAQSIRLVSVVTGNFSIGAMVAVMLIGGLSLGVFLFRHSKSWHDWIVKGEQFIVRHPVIDTVAVLTVITVVILMQSVGQVL